MRGGMLGVGWLMEVSGGGQVAHVRLLRDGRGLEYGHGRGAGGRSPGSPGRTPGGCSARTTRPSWRSRPVPAGALTGRCSPPGWPGRPGGSASRCRAAARMRSSGPGPTCRCSTTPGPALAALRERGWRLAFLTNCDEDLFATTRARLPVPFDEWVTAEEVRSYKPDLAHFRKFAEKTGATRKNWIHVANSWVLDMMPAARMGLRSCGWTGISPGTRPSSRTGGSPACAGCRRRSATSAPSRPMTGPDELGAERAREGRAVGGARRGGGDAAVGLGQAGHAGGGRGGGGARAEDVCEGGGGGRWSPAGSAGSAGPAR